MTNYSIVIEKNNTEESDLFEKELTSLHEVEFESFSSKGFDGIDTMTYLVAVGSTVIVQLARIIVNWTKRNNGKSIKINNIELKGFSKEDIVEILNDIDNK